LDPERRTWWKNQTFTSGRGDNHLFTAKKKKEREREEVVKGGE